jgi:glycosyltransferase involved in cell wall biosynthesis
MISRRQLRIAIDATAVPQRMAGAGVYTYQLARALAEQRGRHQVVVFARPGLFDDLARERKLHLVTRNLESRATRLAWEQTVLPLLLRRLRIDVLHSPHHHMPLLARTPRSRRPKLVVTFHDVTFLLLQDRYPLGRRLYMQAVTRAAARVADAIITPSQTARTDVIEQLRVPAERVVAIYEAAASHFAPQPDGEVARVRTQYSLPERYVLSVGSLEPGKNRDRLMRACNSLRGRVECNLVIAGQPAWGDRPRWSSDAVRFLGYVPDGDLPALYSGAALLAFPSLYEGFGLPVLEAMACGTPVLTSDISATAEIAGDAAVLVNPYSTSSIELAIEQILTAGSLPSSLRERGLERAAQFSWERAAKETLLLYELVAADA